MADLDVTPEIDRVKVKAATDALNDLTAAAVRAQDALADLGMAIVLSGEADEGEDDDLEASELN